MKSAQITAIILLIPILFFGQKPELGIPVGHSDAIQTVALSPDGKYALSGSRDKTIKLWETQNGKLIRTWRPHKEVMGPVVVMSVAFANINKKQYALAASVGDKNPILMWDLETGELERTFTAKDSLDNRSEPSAIKLSVSLDGKFVIAITHIESDRRSEPKSVKIWRIRDGHLVQSFPIQKEEVTSVCFSQNHKFVWMGLNDGRVTQWKPKGLEAEQVFKLHDSPVKSLQVREDGILVSASKNKVVLLNPLDSSIVSEKIIGDCVLKGNSISISSDGQLVFYETDSVAIDRSLGQIEMIQYQMKMVGIDTLKMHEVIPGHTQNINASCFSEDGRYALTGSHDRTLVLWDAQKGKMIRQFGGLSKMLSDVVFSPNKKRLCMLPRFSNDFKVWNLEKGNEFSTLKGHKYEITTVDFLPDNNRILFSSVDRVFRIWDIEKEKVVHNFSKTKSITATVSISPNGEKALTGGENGEVNLWDLKKGTLIKSLSNHGSKIDAIAWSKDGKTAFSGSTNGKVRVWNIQTKTQIKEIKLNGKHWAPVAFAPDGQSFLNFSCQKFELESWNIKTEKVEMTYSLDQIPCGSTSDISYSPDGRSFLLSSGEEVFYWKKDSLEPIKKMHGHHEWVNSVNISSDGNFGVSGGYDGQVNIWELDSDLESPLASIIMLDSSDWVIHTPSGLFDSSPSGFDLLYFLVDMELIDLEQLKERYWEPGLLPILLGLKGGSVRDVEHLDFLPQYPITETELNEEKNLLKVHLKKRTGGIGRVSLYINQKEVNSDINLKRKNSFNEDLTTYMEYFPKGEESTIGLRVYNEEGWLRSPAHELKYMPNRVVSSKGGDDDTSAEEEVDDDPFYEPQLRAIVVGTSDYSGSEMDLNFADDDARRLTKALQEAGKQLFLEGIHIESFYSKTKNENEIPSKKNIQVAFEKLAKESHPKDVLFLFFSGHGMTIGDDFYYLTKDISSMKNLGKDKDLQEKYAISSAEMMEWIRKIKANKQILVLDACHSGKAAELLSMGRSVASTQARALEQLKDRMGMYVLASSEANQKSFETEELGQGLLTYTILLGMKGGALNEQEVGVNRTLEVMNLLNYATNNVPDFAKGIVKKTQQPVLIIPKTSSNFPIGIINEKVNIPIPPKKSVIVNSVFMEEKQYGDPIELSTQLDEVIKENTKPERGNNKIFLNVKHYPDSYSIRGLYTVDGDNVTVNWRLFNGKSTKGPYKATGSKSNPEGLASQILNKAFEVW